jgi:Zn finger protein HypA/HybF involved in hydrogenase expression
MQMNSRQTSPIINTAEAFILCPICTSKTRDRIRAETVLKNYPLYCPKCKRETIISVKNFEVTVIKEPDA